MRGVKAGEMSSEIHRRKKSSSSESEPASQMADPQTPPRTMEWLAATELAVILLLLIYIMYFA